MPDLVVDVAEPSLVDQLLGEGLVEVGVGEGVHAGRERVGEDLEIDVRPAGEAQDVARAGP